MKRKVRITETQLNGIIKKALKEQQTEDQYMTGSEGDQDKMAGAPEGEEGGEGGEPNFEAFVSAAKELMSQGITLGALVDKINEAEEAGEPEEGGQPEAEGEPGVEPDIAPNSTMAESRKRK